MKLPFLDFRKQSASPVETSSSETRELAVCAVADAAQTQQMDPRVARLLKTGATYAQGDVLLPPVAGSPADVLDMEYARKASFCADKPPTEEEVRRDTFPIPADSNREGYLAGHPLAYWLSGLRDFRETRANVAPFVKNGRILDFGGSSGRVIRHFLCQENGWDPWLCDFKPASVAFVQTHFQQQVKAFANTAFPSLPLPDGYFDLVTCFSVFTHINEAEIPWLLELRRIVRVGGVVYVTIHDEATWLNMQPGLRSTVETYRPDVALDGPMPEGRVVATFRHDDPYNCNVFHSETYVRTVWGSFFEIVFKRSLAHNRQGVVILRRKE